jgi:hypothetical protein
MLVGDNLAGHLSEDLVDWLFDHGILPLSTPLSGSWLTMASSGEPHHRAPCLSRTASQECPSRVIDWLEQTVTGWNQAPTPFVWNGNRRQRRARARLRRLGGSGAAVMKGYSIAA